MNNPDAGDKTLIRHRHLGHAGQHLPGLRHRPGRCTATVTVLIPGPDHHQDRQRQPPPRPGRPCGYTITVADTGQTRYAGATVTDDLTSVLADAAYNGDAAATAAPSPTPAPS